MTDTRQQAETIAAQYAAGQPHAVKVTECRDGRNIRPAFRVYVKLAGQARGRHIATIIY